jgi:hypothetical protein
MGFNDLKKFSSAEAGSTGIATTVTNPSTTFGEILVAQIQPVAQGDFIYGFNNQIFTTGSFAGSSVTSANSMAELNSGTSASGSAVVQLRRGLKYKPGEGSLMRSTALFDTPDAGNAQFVGIGNAESGYFVGYFGTDFGILHNSTAATEIQELSITSVDANAQDITITLDGTSTVINLDANSQPSTAAYKIAQADYSQVGSTGWVVDVISSSVYFASARATPSLTGSYSATGINFTGSFSRIQAGLSPTSTFIPSGSFNKDILDGTGISGMVLDPQMGNVYQIGFQYLGFGNAKFFVTNPLTGKPTQFHEIENANSRTTPVLKNPNAAILATSANIGGTTSKTLRTASMAAFTEGIVRRLDPKYAKSFSFTNVNSQTYVPLALIKANRIYKNQRCFGEIDFLKIGASNQDNNKTLTVALFLGAIIDTGDGGTASAGVTYLEVDPDSSIASTATLDPAKDTISNLSSISPFYEVVAGSASAVLDLLSQLDFIFGPGQEVCLAIKTSAQLSGQVSVTWFEQQ